MRGPRPRRRPDRGSTPPQQAPQPVAPVAVMAPEGRQPVTVPASIRVGDLARAFDLSVVDVIQALVNNGLMVTVNQTIDFDTALLIGTELGFEVIPEAQPEPEATADDEAPVAPAVLWTDDDPTRLRPRAPVITILGHVDHGKTSLLDAIRQTNITARESGGITQHIGAYQIEHNGRKITWIDTPGHEAFTAMRARGASITDIAVLVVAADDGVQPQTIEAISHVRAAGVPMVVALNKIDKSDADPDRVKAQLAEAGVTVEDYGGDVPLVPVSARAKTGLDDLLDVIGLVADLKDLRADPERAAIGSVVEAHLERGRGPIATILVRTGTLERGDIVVVGTTFGRVRAMVDDRGKTVNRAEPSRPVEILGLPDVPEAGDVVRAVPDERSAKALVEAEQRRRAAGAGGDRPATLDEMFAQVKEGKAKELRVIVKADVQGSLEAIRSSLAKLPQDEVALNIIHAGVGDISESDVNLAGTSSAVVLGFSNKIDVSAKRAAEQLAVDVRQYKVIYELIDDVQKALTGLLEPDMVEQILGHAEVRQTFTVGKTTIAGSAVLDGVMRRGVQARVLRGGAPVHDGRIASLKRFKDDAREVAAGLECGITLESFNEVAVGDIVEAYTIVATPRTA
jgi:translation initiation factor IF-2